MMEVAAASTGTRRSLRPWISQALVAACWFVAGLGLSRLLYEGLFPAGGWLGRPAGAFGFGALAAAAGLAATRRFHGGPVPLFPLLINLIWLADPVIDLPRSRFLFGASLWLGVSLLAWRAFGDEDSRWRWLGPLLVAAGLLPVYLATMSSAVGAADTFEFQVVAPQLGIAHPTGYPLYLMLGKLFSLLPAGTVAWRLNLASAVYAALAAAVIFRLGLDLLRRPLPALVGAMALGLVPVYWGQAIIAEVYTLHALFVAFALWLMLRLIDANRRPVAGTQLSPKDRKTMVGLAFVLGLGLTNHLTTVFLLPPAALAVLINLWPTLAHRTATISRRRSIIPLIFQLLLAFAVPLALYAYLPLRWAAVNGEPMGFGRLVEWVAGGRFQGALQWDAWWRDPARRAIVARLVLNAWDWFYLVLAVGGLAWLLVRQWRAAMVLFVTAAGFTFYSLNYYVPDLAVFLIPTHVVIAIWVAAGVTAVTRIANLGTEFFSKSSVSVVALMFVLALLPLLLATGDRWSVVDQSGRDGGEPWARAVLARPLARGAAILADSERIAPLYYLQQVEGLRRDLDIMVLPDEAAYRNELDARLAAGQTVYLARYLPGLEGVYYLRSAGPLVEAGAEPLAELPANVAPSERVIGPLRLLGTATEPAAAGSDAAAITLYWTLDRPLGEGERPPALYLRWTNDVVAGDAFVAGSHPAGNAYPVNAWRAGEIVTDYHPLPWPDFDCAASACERTLEAAVAPRFTPTDELEWHAVATVRVEPRPGPVGAARRAFFEGFALDGVEFPATARPAAPLPLRYSGFGSGSGMSFLLVPAHAVSSFVFPVGRAPAPGPAANRSLAFSAEIEPATETGLHALIAFASGDGAAACGWLSPPMTGCVVAEIEISGAPLPEGAANFDDKIALVNVAVSDEMFAPGGQLPVTLTWQGLAEMGEDYTVFVQVLDAADRIVGQVDAWPVQGTFPTSQWRPGETVTDPYVVRLSPDLPPGEYRLHVGLYLLATGRRLPVVDEAGNAVDDKVEVGVRRSNQ